MALHSKLLLLLPRVSGVTAALAWTEANDSASIAGSVTVSGSLAWTEAGDAFSISGTATVSSSVSWAEADDSFAISGSASASSDLSWTEDDDSASLAGVVTAATVVVVGGSRPARRIHPRYIREYDPEDELPEVIQKRRKLTKKVEKLLEKQPAKFDAVALDQFQNKAELEAAFNAAARKIEADKLRADLDEEDDFLLLMI